MGQLNSGPLKGWLVSLLEGMLVVLLTEWPLGDWLVSGRSSVKLAGGTATRGPLEGWLVGSLECWLLALLNGRHLDGWLVDPLEC